jgi:membrane protein YdbS with pleckstrin-like domain
MSYIDDKLGSGEKIVYRAHQHPFVLVRAAAKSFLLFVIAVVLLVLATVVIQPTNVPSDFINTARTVMIIVALIAMFVGVVGVLIQYLFYRNEEFVITNERVIQVQGLINKRQTDSSLSKINDVQTDQTVFGRMFKYGHVNIETGNDLSDPMEFLANPVEFKKHILDAKNGYYGDASDNAPRPRGPYVQNEDGERRQRVAPVPPYAGSPDPRSPGGYDARNPGAYNPNFPPPQQGGYNPAPVSNRAEIPAMIQELGRLRDAGLITQEEFEAKKNDLLRRM